MQRLYPNTAAAPTGKAERFVDLKVQAVEFTPWRQCIFNSHQCLLKGDMHLPVMSLLT